MNSHTSSAPASTLPSHTASPTPSENGEALRDRLFRLLDAIASEEEQQPGDERRQRRWAVQAPVLIGTRRGDAPQTVVAGSQADEVNFPFSRSFELMCHGWATDLCESGVGLLTEEPLPMSEVLYVSLQSLLSEPMLIPIRVAYSRRILAHTYRVGGCFVFG